MGDIRWLQRAEGFLKSADRIYSFDGDFSRNDAAQCLALCGVFALRAALSLDGVNFPRTCNHEIFLNICMEHDVKVPENFKGICRLLHEYDTDAVYNSNYVVDVDDYVRARQICLDYLKELRTQFERAQP